MRISKPQRTLDGDILISQQDWNNIVSTLVELKYMMLESEGVAGYHKNGDIAYWDEFEDLLSNITIKKTGPLGLDHEVEFEYYLEEEL